MNIKRNRGLYLVGGVVRDLLLDKTPRDLDFLLVGKEINMFKELFSFWRNPHNSSYYHLSSFDITFAESLEEDIFQRDFTVNALVINVNSKELVDLVNGVKDLRKGVIRMVTPNIFERDPIRIVRMIRLIKRGFTPEKKTFLKAVEALPLLLGEDKERLQRYYKKLKKGGY